MKISDSDSDTRTDLYPHIQPTPHLFRLHILERYALLDGTGSPHGPSYLKEYKGVGVYIYGLENQAAADIYDTSDLNNRLVGIRNVLLDWDAPNLDTLILEVSNDERFKSGAWQLNEKVPNGIIVEDLPICDRMHTNSVDGMILCGKPKNKYNDGCCGGCVIQNYDQDFEGSNITCPLQEFWDNQRSIHCSQKAA